MYHPTLRVTEFRQNMSRTADANVGVGDPLGEPRQVGVGQSSRVMFDAS